MSEFIFNPQQKQAIAHVRGPMLVVAGAGTGKTSVLVERVARLIGEGHAHPHEILAITYTRNAAAEMQRRVKARLWEAGATTLFDLRALTFHAYCMGILERCGAAFGVLTDEDLYVYLRRRLDQLRLRYYTRAVKPAEFLSALTDFFSRCHDELVTAADYRAYVERLHAGERPLPRVVAAKKAEDISDDEVLARCDEIARVYETVESWLAADNLGTFGHMILKAEALLRSKPDLLGEERRRARFLLIDEFQDANFAQIEVLALLAGPEQNIFVVGDPDQAIYRFRGASSAAFEEFSRRFLKAKGAVLADNQRSRTPVLRCGFGAINHNPPAQCRVGNEQFRRSPLDSAREKRAQLAAADPVEIAICEGKDGNEADTAEAIYIADAIAGLRSRPWSTTANKPRFGVLYRSHSHRDKLLKELAEREIPFSVTGIDLMQTGPVRDLLACLRIIHNPADVEAIFRVAALPQFALDGEAVRDALQPRATTMEAVLKRLPGGIAVLNTIEQARAAVGAAKCDALAAVDIAIAQFSFDRRLPAIAGLRKFVAEDWRERKPKAITGAADLASLLDYCDRFAEATGCITLPEDTNEDDLETVRLMTAHVAKGLEFEHVFVLRMNASSFPTSFRARLFEFPDALRKSVIAQGDNRVVHNEEERRLFYVAMTRARESLVICTRPGKNKRARPVSFVGDLLDDADSAPYRREVRVPPPHPAEATVELAAAAQPAIGLHGWMLSPPSVRMGSISLSATAVEMYEKCPLKFKLNRDWNIPGPPAAALEYGKAMHSVLKDYYDALAAGRPRTIEEAVEMFRRLMAERYFDDAHQRDLYRRQGEEQLPVFLAARAQDPPPDVTATEWSFDLKIGGIQVRGRIDRMDRVDGGVAVIDYKTGKAQKQKDADDSLQLSLYALAVKEKFGHEPARLLIYNLEDAGIVSTKRNGARLDGACERVIAAAEGINAGYFEPKPDLFHCRWCEYSSLCPATEQTLYTIATAAGAG
jgi:DNA helicase-2/ATP-dependent DNA helicase PcrA